MANNGDLNDALKVLLVCQYVHDRVFSNFQESSYEVDLIVAETNAKIASASKTWLSRHDGSFSICSARNFIELALQIGKIRPDVIFVFGWQSRGFSTVALLGAILNIKIVCTTDSRVGDYQRGKFEEKLKRRLVKCADIFWAANHPSKDYIEMLGVSVSRIFVGPLDTIETEHFFSRLSKKAEKKKHEARKLIVVCRLSKEKNLKALLSAFARFLATHGDWQLSIVGHGPEYDQLSELANLLDISNQVKFHGFVEMQDLPEHYVDADVFILPSTRESWGVVVNEAGASGLPLLVSEAAGSADYLVENGTNGYIFHPSVEGVYQALLSISDDESRWGEMGKASQVLANKYSPSAYAKSFHQAAKLAMKTKKNWTLGSLFFVFMLPALKFAREFIRR